MIIKNEQFFYFFLSYIFFMPSAIWFGGQRFGIMLLFIMLVVYILFYPFSRIKISYSTLILISLLFLPLSISLNINYNHISINDSFEFIRIVLYLLIFIVSYNTSKLLKFENIVRISKIFLIFEFIFVILQRFEFFSILNFLEIIWDNEKNWIFRNTGSFSNPNYLAFFVVLSTIIILLYNTSKKLKIFFWLLGFIIIILTGSRTGIITYMLLTPMAIINLDKISIITVVKINLMLCIFLFSFYFLGQYFAEQNKYMFELLKIVSTGDISSVTTFAKRTDNWSNISLKINEFTYFFGLGPGKDIELKWVDNEYLATFSKYGIFGTIITVFIYSFISYKVNKFKIIYLSKLIRLYILLLVVFGLTAETFSSWLLMLPFFMFIGFWEQFYLDRTNIYG